MCASRTVKIKNIAHRKSLKLPKGGINHPIFEGQKTQKKNDKQ